MVLADLRRGVTMRLEQLGDGRIAVLQSLLRARHADLEQAGSEWMLSRDEGRPPGGTRLLPIVVGEERSFPCDAVNIRRSSTHHASVIGTDVPDANVIGHDDEDIGFFLFLFCNAIKKLKPTCLS